VIGSLHLRTKQKGYDLNEEKIVVICPNKKCQQKMHLPKRREVLRVQCANPECNTIFRYRFPNVLGILSTGVLSVASHYSDQPEEKLISISRIEQSTCPYRYFKENLEKPRQVRSFTTIEAGLGRFFHSSAEKRFKDVFVRDATISDKDVLDVDELTANFRLSFMWQGKPREPYRNVRPQQYTSEDFVSRFEKVGQNFNKFLRDRLVGHKVKGIEGGLEIRTNRFCIRGKYDLITEDPDGSVVLWDWKTGLHPKPEYDEEFRNHKVQLGIYATWMRYKYAAPAVRGTVVFLRQEYVEASEIFSSALEQDVLNYTHAWRNRMNRQSSYPPLRNNLCRWCGWNPVCPQY